MARSTFLVEVCGFYYMVYKQKVKDLAAFIIESYFYGKSSQFEAVSFILECDLLL